MTFNKFIWIITLFFCFYTSLGEENLYLNFHKVTLENGLTDDRYNNYIYQDSRGFVWISSIDGLNRYDGLQIKTYRFESGMKGTNIQSNFFEDRSGNIWFTTYESINCYDAEKDSIINYIIKDEGGNEIHNDYKAFYLDSIKNQLWLRADERIYIWNTIKHNQVGQLPEETDAYIFNVELSKDGLINKIVTSINEDTVRFINPYNHKENTSYIIPNSRKAIYLKDSKWLFYQNSNIHIFDEKTPYNPKVIKISKNIFIEDILKYNDDNVFISTKENGMYLYNWKKNLFLKKWKNSTTDKLSLLTNSPRNLSVTSTNYLWNSYQNAGVSFSYLKNSNFHNPLEGVINDNVEITSLLEDNSNNIWASTKFNGVFVFNQKGEYVNNFKYPFSQDDNSRLWQLNKDKEGEIFGISSQSIYFFDLKKKLAKLIIPKTEGIQFKFLNSVYPNRILISSNQGVMELIKNNNGKYNIQPNVGLRSSIEFGFYQIYQTKNKKVFIPYNSIEFWIYEATKDGLKFITKNDTCNLQFYGFYESNTKDTIWAGTSNGLKIINRNNEIISVLNDNSELANGNIYGIVEDNNGILWLTTNNGLWKYNPNQLNQKPVHFEKADGLSGELFSLYHSALLASNGTIWLGNNKGLVKFHPDSIKVHKEIPKLHLDELLVNDTKSFKKYIENSTLVLNHNQNTLTFAIKAVNLYKTKRNKINYQLDGYDEDTLQINNGEKIRYTKIKPGSYTLNAYSEDANGYKSKMKELLSLEINPPWWKTWPFYILYTLLLAIITYSFLKRRENYIIEEQNKKAAVEKLKAQVKLEEETKKREIEKIEAQALLNEQAQKTEIAKLETQVLEVQMIALRTQMNPHFLFNSLNSIKSLILKTKEKEASEYLSKFSTLLRSILDNSEKQKIKLSSEIEALNLYIGLESLRFASNFNYQIQIDKTIDSDFIRIPPLLLQPFVENAIWHGLLPKNYGDSKLNINIIRKEDFLFFEIEDNGVGRKNSAIISQNKNQKSMGIYITKKRIQMLHRENDVEIIDLVNSNKQALGTKVVIKLFAPD